MTMGFTSGVGAVLEHPPTSCSSNLSSPVKSEAHTIGCAGCGHPIKDRFVTTVLDKQWHASCVQCAECGTQLNEKCFAREGRIFCQEDFYQRYGPRCSGCKDVIYPSDLVRKARDQFYHLGCFTCAICQRQLHTGDKLFVMADGAFVCKEDYVTHVLHQNNNNNCSYYDFDEDEEYEDDRFVHPHLHPSPTYPGLPPPPPPSSSTLSSLSPTSPTALPDFSPSPSGVGRPHSLPPELHSPGSQGALGPHSRLNAVLAGPTDAIGTKAGEDPTSHSNGGSDPGAGTEAQDGEDMNSAGKRRGPRTTIKAKQLEVLKTAFDQTPKPTRHIREQLAKETGLPMRVIQVWFQNKRSKERRMKQMSGRGKFCLGPREQKLRGFDMDNRFYFSDFGYGAPPPPSHTFGQPPPPMANGEDAYPGQNFGVIPPGPPSSALPMPPTSETPHCDTAFPGALRSRLENFCEDGQALQSYDFDHHNHGNASHGRDHLGGNSYLKRDDIPDGHGDSW